MTLRCAASVFALLALSLGCSTPSNTFTNSPASTQLIPDGLYVATAAVAKSGGQTTNVPVSGAITNGYKWLGAGKYTETISGIGTIGGNTLDCSSPNEAEITLASDGHMITGTQVRTGCVPVATVNDYTIRYRVITGGMQREITTTVNGAPATFTYTYLAKWAARAACDPVNTRVRSS